MSDDRRWTLCANMRPGCEGAPIVRDGPPIPLYEHIEVAEVRPSTDRGAVDACDRYGIAGRAAGAAVLEHGRDGARLRPANDAFLLSRIARAVVDALDSQRGAVS